SATYSKTAAGILTLGGTDLVSLTSPVTPVQWSVLIKSNDTVLMALGMKGLTSGVIKGLTVCCFIMGAVCLCFNVSTLLCMALICRAMQSSVQELTGERSVLFTYRSLPCRRY
ncbi:unnamed protein product, partial [Staurois parvus]